ncbi:MAG: hypothetical protein PVG66_14980 [Chromatiales bacterium]|jgi:hypothetical protein
MILFGFRLTITINLNQLWLSAGTADTKYFAFEVDRLGLLLRVPFLGENYSEWWGFKWNCKSWKQLSAKPGLLADY